MAKKMLFIYNPHAGKERIRSHLLDIIDAFSKAGYIVTVRPTQKVGDAKREAQCYAGQYDLVVCSGGDGTLDEVVTGMVMRENRIPIGYVPAGTTNDFARSLGISRKMTKAAQDIMDGEKFACDVGHFNSDVFVYVAAFGIFTEVAYETRQELKNVLGHLAYILEGARRLNTIRSFYAKIAYEGKLLEGNFMFGMITNSKSVGGFSGITGKNVDLCDGLFEVLLIKTPTNMIELNAIVTALIAQKFNTDHIISFKTSKLSIDSVDEIPWTLDGENGGTQKHVEIVNEHKGLELIIPKTLEV